VQKFQGDTGANTDENASLCKKGGKVEELQLKKQGGGVGTVKLGRGEGEKNGTQKKD